MKSKTKTNQQQTMNYGWQTPPTTPQQSAFDLWAQTAYDTPDPTIPFQTANMRQQVNNRLNNPFGADYSPEVSEAIKYRENQDINQLHGQALREDSFNRKAAKGQALGASASGHAPVLTQTGGTMTGSTVTNPGWGNMLMGGLQAGASLGSAAMM